MPAIFYDKESNFKLRYEASLEKYILSGYDEDHSFILRLIDKDTGDCHLGNANIQLHKYPKIEGGLSVPLTVQLQITSRCNFKCPFCYAVGNRKGKYKELSFHDFKNILRFLNQWGVLKIEWTGGDPFMKRDFIDLLDVAHDLGLSQSILTNGIILGKVSLYQQVVKRTCSEIQVFINGTENAFDTNTGGKHWHHFKDAIRKIVDVGIPVSAACTVSKTNLSSLGSIIAFCEENKIDVLRFGLIVQNMHFDENYINTITNFKNAAEPIIGEKFHKLNIHKCWEYITEADVDIPLEWSISPGGKTMLYMDAQGDLYPFPFLNTHEFHLGNIKHFDLVSVWQNNPVLNSLRSLNRKNTGCEKCVGICDFWDRAFVYYQTGDISQSSKTLINCTR